MTHKKLKAGVFPVFQIHEFLIDSLLENSTNLLEKQAWQSINKNCGQLPGKHKEVIF
jgi:hypothetical protein